MVDLGKLATSLHLFSLSLSQTSGQVFYASPSHSITQTFGHYVTAAVFGNACGPSIDRVMNCTLDFLENQVLMSYVWDGIAYEAPLSLKSSFKSIWSSSARFNWILLKEKESHQVSADLVVWHLKGWLGWFHYVKGMLGFSLKFCPYDVIKDCL